jgi:type I restriction enzyme S subunit
MADKRRVKDILLRLKTPVEIKDTEFYKRLTIRINHQGVSLRDTEIGAKIGTKSQFRVRAGDFILSKIDARQGAFGIVPPEADGGIITGNFWTFRVDNQLVDTEWFLQFTNSNEFLDLCKRSSTGNTHRKYLNENVFLNHELTIPSLKEQGKAVAACKVGNKSVEEVQYEITQQQSLLAKLKQAILQEAIQGKLTADWRGAHPEVEPASQLLLRIQAEKARLIADKKLRPEKPLSKITPAEIPFEIPKDWEWCRLGVMIGLVSGQHIEAADYNAQGRGVPYLTGPSDFGMRHPTFTRWTEKPKVTAQNGDLLITVKGSGVGKMNVLHEDGVAIGRQLMAVRPCIVHEEFIVSYLRSQYDALQEAKEGQIPGIGRDDILEKLIPLPPLAEQVAIVERVEALMTTARALEAEIEQARTHAADLLQAVLKEAFAPASS